MSTPNTAVAVIESQAVAQLITTGQTGAVAEPISAAQAEIALVPSQLTPAQVDKLPVPQFRKLYDNTVTELQVVKGQNTELATQVKDLQPLADKIEVLGGLPYIEQAVAAANLYADLAVIPLDGSGELTRKHYETGQKFIDAVYEMSPVGGDRMSIIMDNHWGAIHWNKFGEICFGLQPGQSLSNDQIAAVKAFAANGFQLPQVTPAENGKLPPFCYDEDGAEIPENVAWAKQQQRRAEAAETQVKGFLDQQKTKTEAQKQQEADQKRQQQDQREQDYRKDALSPVEKAVVKAFPDFATNPSARLMRQFLTTVAEDTAGDTLKNAIKDAGLGQMARAKGALVGIQAKITVAVGEAADKWLQLQNGSPAPLQQQLDKVKTAETGAPPSTPQSGAIPWRPERGDFPKGYEGLAAYEEARNRHNAEYRARFASWDDYNKATTRQSAA